MELIELDATAQRALELLTNAGMSDGSICAVKSQEALYSCHFCAHH